MNMKDSQINVHNFSMMRAQQPESFEFIRLDRNNDCNVHCVYCHNHRSSDLIDFAELGQFFESNVIAVNNVQVGCIMEPTLDRRLGDLLLLIARSRAKPSDQFILQTNGILLHMHDQEKLRESGLNALFVSIDSPDSGTQRVLRGGTSLSKVLGNIAAFRKDCPDVRVAFVTTVTKANLPELESLVVLGVDLGATTFVFRELFYDRDNNMVDHGAMPRLLLDPGDFEELRQRILGRFGHRAIFEFADKPTLVERIQRTRADSFR